jgi:hypothetical protein
MVAKVQNLENPMKVQTWFLFVTHIVFLDVMENDPIAFGDRKVKICILLKSWCHRLVIPAFVR